MASGHSSPCVVVGSTGLQGPGNSQLPKNRADADAVHGSPSFLPFGDSSDVMAQERITRSRSNSLPQWAAASGGKRTHTPSRFIRAVRRALALNTRRKCTGRSGVRILSAAYGAVGGGLLSVATFLFVAVCTLNIQWAAARSFHHETNHHHGHLRQHLHSGVTLPFALPFNVSAMNREHIAEAHSLEENHANAAAAFWRLDPTGDTVTVAMATTSAYVAFGVNPSAPAMAGADIVACHNNQGSVAARDYVAPAEGHGTPKEEDVNDWTLVEGGVGAGTGVWCVVTRKLKTSGRGTDVDVQIVDANATVSFVMAWGLQSETSELHYHGKNRKHATGTFFSKEMYGEVAEPELAQTVTTTTTTETAKSTFPPAVNVRIIPSGTSANRRDDRSNRIIKYAVIGGAALVGISFAGTYAMLVVRYIRQNQIGTQDGADGDMTATAVDMDPLNHQCVATPLPVVLTPKHNTVLPMTSEFSTQPRDGTAVNLSQQNDEQGVQLCSFRFPETHDDNLDSVSLLSFNDSESATVSVLPPLAEDVHPPSEASGMKQVRFSKQALALDEFDERLMKAIVEKKGESSLWPTYSSFSSNTASTEPTR